MVLPSSAKMRSCRPCVPTEGLDSCSSPGIPVAIDRGPELMRQGHKGRISRPVRNFRQAACRLLELDLDIHARGQISFISASTVLSVGSMMSIRRWCADLELVARALLSTCGETQQVETLDAGPAAAPGPRTTAPVRLAVSTISRPTGRSGGSRRPFRRMRIFWFMHDFSLKSWYREKRHNSRWAFSPEARTGDYSMILATTPAPTVRPPSRMAKRRPSSMAIGRSA